MKSARKTSYMKRKCYKNQTYRKMKVFYWNGFEITIWNNRIYGFKYEYTCRPVTNQTINMVKKELTYPWEQNSMNDVTSHLTVLDAIYAGKRFVSEFISISWKLHCKGRLK